MFESTLFVVLLTLHSALSNCDSLQEYPGDWSRCKNQPNWHVGADRNRGGGVVVHGHADTPASQGVSATIHGSHVFGGSSNGAQTLGGGVNYQHQNGLHGKVDATHHRGQGNAYSATVGGSTKLGPGTLSIDGGAGTQPGSSHVRGQVGASYSVPLP